MFIEQKNLLRVMSPILRAASNVIEKLTDGISMRKQINVTKTLDEAEAVMGAIQVLTRELNVLLGVREGDADNAPRDEFINRVQLLAYLNSLPGLCVMGKCRMNPDGLGFELVLHHEADIWHVMGRVLTVNADTTYGTPPWLISVMVEMTVELGHPTWSNVSVGHFMSYASPYLRGLKE